ncbi:unnamed protein product [Meloidogyne enterolobii]|uniref:Uncharacterized protein n=1 Tax=Meloidogyne enterolobii TaxID=390850 RepID=A0ACB1B1L1_MELEN
MKYKLFILFVFSLIEIGGKESLLKTGLKIFFKLPIIFLDCMDDHNSQRGLRRRRKYKHDDSPVLPPQVGTPSKAQVGTSKHVPKRKPASPKPPNPQMPSSPLPKPEETPVSLNEICDAFGVPFEAENALRQQNFNALEGPSQAKISIILKFLF